MIFDYSLAGLVSLGLLFYLTYALLRPERFWARHDYAGGSRTGVCRHLGAADCARSPAAACKEEIV